MIRTKSKRSKSVSVKRWMSLPFTYLDDNYKNVTMIRKSANSIYSFAANFDVNRDDISFLERQMPIIILKLKELEAKLMSSIQVSCVDLVFVYLVVMYTL